MEKELKSCTGILLRADLTGHGHSTLFGRNWLIGWIGSALLGQPSKAFFDNTFILGFNFRSRECPDLKFYNCYCFFCIKIKELPKYTNKSTHRKIVAKVGHKADLFANIYNMFSKCTANVLQKYIFWKLLLFKDNKFIIGA